MSFSLNNLCCCHKNLAEENNWNEIAWSQFMSSLDKESHHELMQYLVAELRGWVSQRQNWVMISLMRWASLIQHSEMQFLTQENRLFWPLLSLLSPLLCIWDCDLQRHRWKISFPLNRIFCCWMFFYVCFLFINFKYLSGAKLSGSNRCSFYKYMGYIFSSNSVNVLKWRLSLRSFVALFSLEPALAKYKRPVDW